MNRELIIISGLPGSGKSTLGRSLVDSFNAPFHIQRDNAERAFAGIESVEHLSLGDRVRKIGNQTIKSHYTPAIQTHLNGPFKDTLLDDEIAYAVAKEAIEEHDNVDLLLLDGYPRTPDQITGVEMIEIIDQRTLTGMLITHIDPETAIARLVMRRKREFETNTDIQSAKHRVEWQSALLRPTQLLLFGQGVNSRTIDMSGQKNRSLRNGLIAISELRGKNTPY